MTAREDLNKTQKEKDAADERTRHDIRDAPRPLKPTAPDMDPTPSGREDEMNLNKGKPMTRSSPYSPYRRG
jgi:hypothetical protein